MGLMGVCWGWGCRFRGGEGWGDWVMGLEGKKGGWWGVVGVGREQKTRGRGGCGGG